MNTDELLSLLEQTLRQKLIIAGILWLFAILSLIRSEICYKKGKISSKKKRKDVPFRRNINSYYAGFGR